MPPSGGFSAQDLNGSTPIKQSMKGWDETNYGKKVGGYLGKNQHSKIASLKI